ncbi:MAG: hypothetical protein EOS50_01570 [Mesorhizobium sp.]|nr:MAG: hypothetical protein EOS50_01570 [Mesorhizobium sp.]
MVKDFKTEPAFINQSDLSFTDISSEKWREYKFAGGDTVRIVRPLRLHVSDSRGHRIFDAEGRSHYVPWGWIHLVWEAKDGEPNFVR